MFCQKYVGDLAISNTTAINEGKQIKDHAKLFRLFSFYYEH